MLQNEPYSSAVPAVQSRNDFRYPGLLERAGLAHELGNLIQVASSAMNIVSRNSNVQTNADLEPVLSGARTSLDRAGLLVRQTLLREKTADEEFDPIEVGQYLTDVARVVLHTWPPEIRVRLSLQPDLPAVRCDPLALHNAILNLALNARAAMPDGGEIDITARTMPADNGSASIQISVSDTGIGMNEDTAKRAWDPFFTTNATGLGGLGLPIVRSFVEGLKGTVNIDSMPGVGTSVILQLPASS